MTGPALDWAVELALGTPWSDAGWFTFKNPYRYDKNPEWKYSTEWSIAGPIIEWEKITVEYDHDRVFDLDEVIEPWLASIPFKIMKDSTWDAYGPTPLIAAMRCFVVSKLGDEVEVPQYTL